MNRNIGQYVLQKRLGSGGFGEVYLARDTNRDCQVAVKVLLSAHAGDPQFRHRFMTEGLALTRLEHPNIVTLHEIKEDDSGIYIVMEYVEGESLRSEMSRGPIEISRALGIGRQIADALTTAHRAGIIHRDVKPENVIINAQRGAVLLDFGLARLAGDATVTQAGKIMGTWKYMSPEQLRGESGDGRSDIFALGIVLSEMLTGKRPFGGEYDAAVVYSILHDVPRPLSRDDCLIPAPVQTVIMRTLRKEPLDRYQSMSDFADDLGRIVLGQEPVQVTIEDTTQISSELVALAVLYLRNQGPDEQEYIAYGVTEDLIMELSRIQRLKVSPMRSVLPYQKSTATLRSIARELEVRYIIDGSLTSRNGLIVLAAQLIDALSDQVVWSTRWEGQSKDLVELTRSLSDGVVRALNLVRDDKIRLETEPAHQVADPVAYEFYLRAKYLFEHKKSAADVEVAAGLYGEAIQKEPSLISAYLGLARIHIHQGENHGAVRELESALERSRQMRLRLVETEIEISLSEAHFRLAEWEKAQQHAECARSLAKLTGDLSSEAKVLTILIDILEPQARYDEAMAHYRRVVQINQQLQRKDKIAAAIKSIAVIYHRRGQYAKALHHYEEALELCRSQDLIDLEAKILNNVGLVRLQLGDLDQSRAHFERALELHRQLGESASYAVNLNNLGVVHHTKGDYESAHAYFSQAAWAAENVEDLRNFALAVENQGKALVMLGDYEGAESKSLAAKEIASRLNYLLVMVTSEKNLGDIDLYQSRYREAGDHFATALTISEQADLKTEQLILLMAQAKLFERTDEYSRCLLVAGRGLALARQLRLRKQGLLARAYRAYCRLALTREPRFLRNLTALVGQIDDRIEVQHAILMRRLLGHALLHFDGSVNNALQANQFLAQALHDAVRHKIAFEQHWIREILGKA